MDTPNNKRDHTVPLATTDTMIARRDLLRVGGLSLIAVKQPAAKRDVTTEIVWIGHRNLSPREK